MVCRNRFLHQEVLKQEHRAQQAHEQLEEYSKNKDAEMVQVEAKAQEALARVACLEADLLNLQRRYKEQHSELEYQHNTSLQDMAQLQGKVCYTVMSCFIVAWHRWLKCHTSSVMCHTSSVMCDIQHIASLLL